MITSDELVLRIDVASQAESWAKATSRLSTRQFSVAIYGIHVSVLFATVVALQAFI